MRIEIASDGVVWVARIAGLKGCVFGSTREQALYRATTRYQEHLKKKESEMAQAEKAQ
jgi:hypothetical protein